jgi:hypothetical protein
LPSVRNIFISEPVGFFNQLTLPVARQLVANIASAKVTMPGTMQTGAAALGINNTGAFDDFRTAVVLIVHFLPPFWGAQVATSAVCTIHRSLVKCRDNTEFGGRSVSLHYHQP